MKIAISSQDGQQNTQFSPRFGRAAYFLLYETDSGSWSRVENPASQARGGSGTQAVQFLVDQDVQVVISGRYGPTAFSAIEQSGIKAFRGESGTPAELLREYQSGSLSQATHSSGKGFHGG